MSDIFADFFEPATPALATLGRKEAFKLLDSIVPKRSSLPVLMCVKVTGNGGYLTLEATDLDYGCNVRIENYLGFQGAAVVFWKEFKAKAGMVSVGKMEGFAVDDFPIIPDSEGEEVGDSWIEAAKKVVYAVSANTDSRLSWTGIYAHKDGVVATDGHVMQFVRGHHDIDAIVPPKLVKLLQPEPTKVQATDMVLSVTYPWGSIVSKVIEGPYPNYRQLITDTVAHQVTVPVGILRDLCKKAIDWNNSAPRIALENGGIYVYDTLGKSFKAHDLEIPEGAQIHFNPRLLLSVIKDVQEPTVSIGYRATLAGMRINFDNEKEVKLIMPLRPTENT